MSESTVQYDTVRSMKLNHLPNDAKLILQKQTGGKIPPGTIQFGLPSTFVNSDNGQDVWSNGPSVQLEQIPELIEMLKYAHEKYSGKDTSETSAKTNTFADILEE